MASDCAGHSAGTAWLRRAASGFAVPLVLILLSLNLVAAFAGYFQVSSHRTLFERLYAHRLLLLASESAFEEASAAIEGLNRRLPGLPTTPAAVAEMARSSRNLKASLALPSEVVPELTRQQMLDQGVTLGPVRLSSSSWVIHVERVAQERGELAVRVRELGILVLEVDVTVRAGSSELKGTASCRRYMDASPETPGSPPALHVLPRNMVLQVPGAP